MDFAREQARAGRSCVSYLKSNIYRRLEMRKSIFNVIVIAAIVISLPVLANGQIASSTFDTSNEDWTVLTTLNNTAPTTWQSSGGNPGGYAMGQDIDNGAWSFSAPEDFLGPVSAAFGDTLSFDIAHLAPEPNSTGWVGISGGSLVEYGLVHPFDGPAQGMTWYHHVITLDASGDWHKIVDPNIPTTVPATNADILSVLQSLDKLIISGEFADGLETDIAGLDNVILMPEPASMFLLALAGFGLVIRKRK